MSKIIVQLNPDVTPAGSDLSIVNAARRSFNTRSDWDYFSKSCRSVQCDPVLYCQADLDEFFNKALNPKDKRLLEFLARGMTADDFDYFVSQVPAPDTEEHTKELTEMLWQWRNTPTHDTPFNHTFISFEVKAPIFVRAQLVKHEYLIMSEYSRRYITDDVEFYRHEYREAAKNKKQGSGGKHPLWNHGVGTGYMEDVYEHYDNSIDLYRRMVEDGVAPEEARGVLPQDLMTEWTWSGTLGAFAKMCTLRLHPEAQYEARLVAKEVYKYLQEYYPVAAKALVEGPDV